MTKADLWVSAFRFSKRSLLLVGIVVAASTSVAQPTGTMIARVLMVQSQDDRGTIFMLDVDQHEYWITAKHILTGAKHPPYGTVESKSVSLHILNPGVPGEQWLPENFSVIDPGNDIDIVVLAPPESLLKTSLASVNADSTGALLGDNCEFLGFPFGAAWRATYVNGATSWMPFVKHCTISATIREPERIWVLDGINNGGFSGGPVFFGTGDQLKIFGVVSGYKTEPTDVMPLDPAVKPNAKVNVNSGFFIAYDIIYAIDAIRKNPIGPVREGK
jgi:hypothetical protein